MDRNIGKLPVYSNRYLGKEDDTIQKSSCADNHNAIRIEKFKKVVLFVHMLTISLFIQKRICFFLNSHKLQLRDFELGLLKQRQTTKIQLRNCSREKSLSIQFSNCLTKFMPCVIFLIMFACFVGRPTSRKHEHALVCFVSFHKSF